MGYNAVYILRLVLNYRLVYIPLALLASKASLPSRSNAGIFYNIIIVKFG